MLQHTSQSRLQHFHFLDDQWVLLIRRPSYLLSLFPSLVLSLSLSLSCSCACTRCHFNETRRIEEGWTGTDSLFIIESLLSTELSLKVCETQISGRREARSSTLLQLAPFPRSFPSLLPSSCPYPFSTSSIPSSMSSSSSASKAPFKRRHPIQFLSLDTLLHVLNKTVFSPSAIIGAPVLAYLLDRRSAPVPDAYPSPSLAQFKFLMGAETPFPWLRRLFFFVVAKTLNAAFNRYARNHGHFKRDKPDWKKVSQNWLNGRLDPLRSDLSDQLSPPTL